MTVEVIPFKNFKERLQLVKELKEEQLKLHVKFKIILTIEAYDNYLYVERVPYGFDGRMYQ